MREILHQYKESVLNVIESINEKSVGSAVYGLKKAREKGQRVFIIGNGGSAAVALHFAVDLTFNAVPQNEKNFKVIPLAGNVPMLTSGDGSDGYETMFTAQLSSLMEVNDIIVAISTNGNEPNIIAAVQYAHTKHVTVVALTGLTGGKLRELADVCVHIDCQDPSMIDDAHMVVCHMLAYWFKENLNPVNV